MSFIGLNLAGGGAAVFDRLGQGGDKVLYKFRALGLQVGRFGRVFFQIVQLYGGQLRVLFCRCWLGSTPSAGAGAEGKFPFAVTNGERAVDRVMNGERPLLGLRLAKQCGQEGKRILSGVSRDGVALAEHVGDGGEEIGGAYGLVGG